MTKRWADYDVSHMAAFLDALAQWRPSMLEPEPIDPNPPPPLPSKESAVWQDATLLIDRVRLRDAPFTTANAFRQPGRVLVILDANTPVKVWLEPNYEEDGWRWVGVWHGEHVGWMALVAPGLDEQFKLAEAPAPPPPPEPEPPAPEPEPEPDELTALRMQREALQQVIEGIDKMAQGLQVLTLLISDRIEELEDVA